MADLTLPQWPFRSNKGHKKTTITSSTAAVVIVPAYQDTFADLYGLVISNTSASSTNVSIKDNGNEEYNFAVPAGDTRGFMLPLPSAHQQDTKEKTWTATCAGSVDSIIVTALFVQNS